MDIHYELQPLHSRHDLMIELGQVEMAMDHLDDRPDSERQLLRPRLLSRMNTLRGELQHRANEILADR